MSDLNIVFLGSSSFVIPILEDISANSGKNLGQIAAKQLSELSDFSASKLNLPSNWQNLPELSRQVQISLVISQPDRQLRQKLVSNPVSELARKKNFTLFTPQSINKEFENSKILAEGFDLGIVASFGQIISQQVLDLAQIGFLNWHPSKLPMYRGATPMQTALRDGQTETALSWISMTKEMDAGDVWLQKSEEIKATEKFETLATKMGILGSKTWALAAALKILSLRYSQIKPETQDHTQATFCSRLNKEDAFVDPTNLKALDLFNHWRAYHLFPGTKLTDKYFGQSLKLAVLKTFVDTNEFLELESNSLNQIVYGSESWVQIKTANEVQTFLRCHEGAVQVEQIILENGKNINFRGYRFN